MQAYRRFLKLFFTMLAVALSLNLYCDLQAQEKENGADDLIGTYMLFEHKNQITLHLNFYKADNGTFQARISWMDQPDDDLGKPRTDINNPRPELRHIPLTHVVIVRDLHYDAKNREWEGGRIYDPGTGKTYRCFVRFEDESTLRVKAYVGIIGFRFVGRSFYWTRVS